MATGRENRDDTMRWQAAETAEFWRQSAAVRAQVATAATELMLDLAGVGPGMRVLDVGAGTGDQTLMAARRIGPAGSVLATDTSATMLQVAAEEARGAGLSNVETRVMDAHNLDLESDSFDAAIARNVVMLLDDPQKALAEIRRVLKPGARLAAMVFSEAEKNPSMSLPQGIIRRVGGLPAPGPGEPGVFALGAPGALEEVFRAAGFRHLAVRAVPLRRRFESVAEALRNLRDSPLTQERMERMTEQQQAQAWAEIEKVYRKFQGPDGWEAPGESLIGVGTK